MTPGEVGGDPGGAKRVGEGFVSRLGLRDPAMAEAELIIRITEEDAERKEPTKPAAQKQEASKAKSTSGNGDEAPAPSLPRFTLLTQRPPEYWRSEDARVTGVFMVNDVIGEILSISLN